MCCRQTYKTLAHSCVGRRKGYQMQVQKTGAPERRRSELEEVRDLNEKMDEVIDELNKITKWTHATKSAAGFILGIMILGILFAFITYGSLASLRY